MSALRPIVSTIVFDLDGTLVDSAPDIHAAANRLMVERGLPEFDLATITSFVGNGIPTLVRRCFDAARCDLEQSALEAATERFKEIYAEEPSLRTRFYPGVREALSVFQDGGSRLGVCTNKSEALSRALLSDLNIENLFGVVIGGDTLPTRKPDPAGLMAAISRLGGDPDTALYVGDSEVDAETAAAARIRFALFSGGYRKAPIETLPHWHVFDDMRRLEAVIELRGAIPPQREASA